MTETRRIHFIGDVEDLGAAYRCKRCGHATATAVEMKWHRNGIISPCLRARAKQKLQKIHDKWL